MKRLCVLVLVMACRSSAPVAPATPPPLANEVPKPAAPQRLDIDSADILARTETAPHVLVKHILFGWAELDQDAYQGRIDPRAKKRTQAEAAKLAEDVAAQLRANPGALPDLIARHSEDPGSQSEPYEIKPDSPFVPEFKALGLRLRLDEVGIVKTRFGYHVMFRIAPPPPDPLESAAILARPNPAESVDVMHILIGWEGLDTTMDAINKPRTKAEADALATELLKRVSAGDDIVALMRQYSDDGGSASHGKPITVSTHTPMVEPFKNLALRLHENEAGLVKTRFGWHVIQRLPPPPPDPLESVAILARTTVAERVKVKHILLGWKEVNADDPRGKTRTRADLETLVKATLKKLAKKGANFEKLMADLSEDPGSASSGEAYEATPDAGLVKPFLRMSLRLQLHEIGVVKTDFGIHIIKRVE